MSFLIDIVLVIVAFLIILGISLILYARWNYGTLEAMGIPVVKPHWLLGSNHNFMELIYMWEDLKRAKELGPIYGVYNGRTPEVYVSDPDMLYRIFLKDSDHFANKREPDFGHPVLNEMLEVLNGEKWKLVRNTLSPFFTSGKIKQLSETVERLSKEYVGALVKDSEAEGGRLKINFTKFLAPFAIEVMGECFCGIKLENARDPANAFVASMRGALGEDFAFDLTMHMSQVFPFLMKLLNFSLGTMPDGLEFFRKTFCDIIDEREKNKNQRPDTVNALMEMRQKIRTSEEYKRLGMNEDTVYGQAFVFFAASFVGFTHLLGDLCYNLATNPKVTKKVTEEVDQALVESNGNISYEVVSKMPYLTSCISETFRKTPHFFRPDRVCTEDWKYKGIIIKKGTEVFAPLYAIHYNPDIYPEPEKFIPERFLPENKDKLLPCTFLTFGQGNRLCLGIRFAYELFKLFMVHLLKEFKIEIRSDTVWKARPGNPFFAEKDPVYLDIVKRN